MPRSTDPETREYRKLKKYYKKLTPAQLAVADGLIRQAARLKVRLDELNEDIKENGLTEMFSQSEKTEPYERERPASAIFAKLDKNYQTIIKQLNDMLPPPDVEADALDEFRI